MVATLGYLGLGIRQNTESVRLSTELELTKLVIDFHARVTGQPDLLRIWDAAADPASLAPEDIRRFRWLVAEWFLIFDGQYDFYTKGHISEKPGRQRLIPALGCEQIRSSQNGWRNGRRHSTGSFVSTSQRSATRVIVPGKIR
jgi:hypothetical protein